jgi:hypothetical protein
MKKLFLALFLASASSTMADVTINLDAGQLTGSPTAAMIADDSSPSNNGSLLLLVDIGAGAAADNLLTSGEYVAGGNLILAAGGFNNNGGTNETNTVFDIPSSLFADNNGTANAGDELVLRYFPQITFANFKNGILPVAGDFFNTVQASNTSVALDGGNTFTLPTDGSAIALDYFTTNSDGGGSEVPTPATMVVLGSVPEPSDYALLLLGLGFLFFARKLAFKMKC